MEKIRRHLSSIYRQFLRTGNVEIIVNGQSLEAPDYGILYAPFYKTPDGENILWRKEIDFEMGEYKAKGFIAILDKIQKIAEDRRVDTPTIGKITPLIGAEISQYLPPLKPDFLEFI